MSSERSAGFSLVELVATLVVLSIISSAAMSRFADVSVFDKKLASDAIVSLLRETQLLAFSNSDTELRVEDQGSSVRLSARVGGQIRTSREFSKSEVSLRFDSNASDFASTCSVLSSNLTLEFNEIGEIKNWDSGNYSEGFLICVGATSSVCVSPAGFASVGGCS